MAKTYRTAEIAAIIGVHPNTVRFYEGQGLLPKIPRAQNGYRIYSQRHLNQLHLIRAAFRAEILSGDLRNQAIDIVKTAAAGEYAAAVQKTRHYQNHLRAELDRAQEAIALTKQMLHGPHTGKDVADQPILGRREAAAVLGVSVDVLRDWERNGLIQVPRKGRRRQYGRGEMMRLKVISLLRRANYSQMSVRRMLVKIDGGEQDILSAINIPDPAEDILSVTDRYITSLTGALADAEEMLNHLK